MHDTLTPQILNGRTETYPGNGVVVFVGFHGGESWNSGHGMENDGDEEDQEHEHVCVVEPREIIKHPLAQPGILQYHAGIRLTSTDLWQLRAERIVCNTTSKQAKQCF